jgi:methylated-DNA-[protein]-cysteine S-methyltransferase
VNREQNIAMITDIINTPFSFSVQISYGTQGVTGVSFISKSKERLAKHEFSYITQLLKKYFNGEEIEFNVPHLLPALPPFTNKVLEACKKIPYGKTLTYKELAQKSGNIRAARAVGNALRRNPIPIIIPCHRVIGTDGGLHGFMGKEGVEIKRQLLILEVCER